MFKKFLNTCLCLLVCYGGFAQGTVEDYTRAKQLRHKIADKLFDVPLHVQWNEAGTLCWYEKNTASGKKYILVDPASKSKSELFDVRILEQALSKELNKTVKWDAVSRREMKLIDRSLFTFEYDGVLWSWDLE